MSLFIYILKGEADINGWFGCISWRWE